MKNVNDRYQQHYKNIEMKDKYNKEKRDYSWIFMVGFFAVPMCFLILIGMAVATNSNNKQKINRNKFIEIGENSLGCVKYRYNQDTVWRCPKSQSINQIETRVCSGGIVRTCRTEYELVIN